jgi:hypothetical protein
MQHSSSQGARPSARNTSSRFTRHKTRHRGISYREHSDGSRTYFVYHDPNRKLGTSPYVEAGSSEKALAKQAELRHRTARGEKVVVPGKVTFQRRREIAQRRGRRDAESGTADGRP